MSAIGSVPIHPTCLEPQMRQTCGKVTLHRAQHERCLPIAGQGNQLVQQCRSSTCWDLCINRANPLEQVRCDSSPSHRIAAAHDHQSLRGDSALPSRRRTQPTAHIEIRHRSQLLPRRQHHQSQPGQSKTGMADQTSYSSRLQAQYIRRTEFGCRPQLFKMYCSRHPFSAFLGDEVYRTYVR